MLGDDCWLAAKPNCRLFGRPVWPPLGMKPEVPAEVIVTDGFLVWSPWEAGAGAPLTMVTPGVWDCCMGLPLTGDAVVDFPCCDGPPTVTGAAVESVADFLVALA